MKEEYNLNLDDIEDASEIEVGWYYQVFSINRASGKVTLRLAKQVFIKDEDAMYMRVVFTDKD